MNDSQDIKIGKVQNSTSVRVELIDILGTQYEMRYTTPDVVPELEYLAGFCDSDYKYICINLMRDDDKPAGEKMIQETKRHELLHAFLNECGLGNSAVTVSVPWTMNEEMIDWFAIQFPRLLDLYKRANCI